MTIVNVLTNSGLDTDLADWTISTANGATATHSAGAVTLFRGAHDFTPMFYQTHTLTAGIEYTLTFDVIALDLRVGFYVVHADTLVELARVVEPTTTGTGFTASFTPTETKEYRIGSVPAGDHDISATVDNLTLTYNGELLPTDTDPFGDGSLEHLYKLDGSSVDSVGSYNLTEDNAQTYSTGRFDEAWNKTVTPSHRLIIPKAVLNDSLSAFSISLWMNPNALPTSDSSIINGWSTDSAFLLYHDVSPEENKLRVLLRGSLLLIGLTTDVAVAPNQWGHLVFTFDSTGIRLYLNDVLIGEDTQDAGVMDALTSDIGFAVNQAGSDVYDGGYDHLMFFYKSLSASEVSKLYTMTPTALPSDTPPIVFNGVTTTQIFFNGTELTEVHLNGTQLQ